MNGMLQKIVRGKMMKKYIPSIIVFLCLVLLDKFWLAIGDS